MAPFLTFCQGLIYGGVVVTTSATGIAAEQQSKSVQLRKHRVTYSGIDHDETAKLDTTKEASNPFEQPQAATGRDLLSVTTVSEHTKANVCLGCGPCFVEQPKARLQRKQLGSFVNGQQYLATAECPTCRRFVCNVCWDGTGDTPRHAERSPCPAGHKGPFEAIDPSQQPGYQADAAVGGEAADDVGVVRDAQQDEAAVDAVSLSSAPTVKTYSNMFAAVAADVASGATQLVCLICSGSGGGIFNCADHPSKAIHPEPCAQLYSDGKWCPDCKEGKPAEPRTVQMQAIPAGYSIPSGTLVSPQGGEHISPVLEPSSLAPKVQRPCVYCKELISIAMLAPDTKIYNNCEAHQTAVHARCMLLANYSSVRADSKYWCAQCRGTPQLQTPQVAAGGAFQLQRGKVAYSMPSKDKDEAPRKFYVDPLEQAALLSGSGDSSGVISPVPQARAQSPVAVVKKCPMCNQAVQPGQPVTECSVHKMIFHQPGCEVRYRAYNRLNLEQPTCPGCRGKACTPCWFA